MTMRSRPNRGAQADRDAFVDQAAAVETKRLNCFIPMEMHDRLRITAAQERTDMTTLVVAALERYFADRG